MGKQLLIFTLPVQPRYRQTLGLTLKTKSMKREQKYLDALQELYTQTSKSGWTKGSRRLDVAGWANTFRIDTTTAKHLVDLGLLTYEGTKGKRLYTWVGPQPDLNLVATLFTMQQQAKRASREKIAQEKEPQVGQSVQEGLTYIGTTEVDLYQFTKASGEVLTLMLVE